MTTVLTKSQTKTFRKSFQEGGTEYLILATARYDDECGNGHNSFALTGEIWRAKNGRKVGRDCESCGCIHEEIVKHFPELAPLLKWHLTSADGPMHYVANTVYHASERDCWGLLKGEVRQIINGRSKLPAWEMVAKHRTTGEILPLYKLNKNQDALDCPTMEYDLIWHSWDQVGEGKVLNLIAARSCAVWPDATDEELTAPGLKERLEARLPGLMAEFQADMEGLGFIY